MNLNVKNFDLLIKTIFNKFQNNIVITAGKISVKQFADIISTCFINDTENIFYSKKYKDVAKSTRASFCITTESLKNDLPKNCNSLIVGILIS